MEKPPGHFVFRNLANVTSVLGVLPLALLFFDNGYQYLIPLIIFNNVMDDLDGIVAAKLNIRSRFGANLDNVCDVVAHVVLVFSVGAHFGDILIAGSVMAAASIILRVTSRLDPGAIAGTGSPTNELMRHMLFALLLLEQFAIRPVYLLMPVFLLHSVSMLVPYRMPALIRSRTRSASMIGLVNVALLAAWLLSPVTPVVAAAFVGTYLYSFALEGARWRRMGRNTTPAPGPDGR